MLKPGKTPIHHVALTEQSVMVARAASPLAPNKFSDYRVFELSDEKLEESLLAYLGIRKGQYARAYCSVFPASRFIRKVSLDSPNRVKDAAYMKELLSNTCKISSEENEVVVLQASGEQIDAEKPSGKDIIFVGARTDELLSAQNKLISWGIFPLRLEIGTLPMAASIRKVAKAEGRKNPTLILEVGETQSHIYIVSEAGLDMTRSIPFGVASMLPQIKAELGLADEVVARKILLANTFDFAEMAPALLRRLIKEIQASVGFYEVQTGYTIGQIYLANLSSRFGWVGNHLARSLGLDIMTVAFDRWLEVIGVEVDEASDINGADPFLWNLFSLAGTYE